MDDDIPREAERWLPRSSQESQLTISQCDQIKPICGACRKRKDPHMCHYEEAQWSVHLGNNNETLVGSPSNGSSLPHRAPYNSELQALNERIRSLEAALHQKGSPISPQTSTSSGSATYYPHPPSADDYEIMNFQKNHYEVHGMPTQGSLSWVSLLRKDVYLNCIHVSVKNRNRIMSQVQKKDTKDMAFKNKFTNQTDLNAKLQEQCKHIDKNKPLSEHIKETLVDQKLIWLLVDRFFDSELYFIMPILERAEFCKQLTGVIGRRDSETGLKWSLTKKVQYTTIGILIIIMRLASLSLYNAGKAIQRELTAEDKYILEHPVSESIMRIAEKCYREIQSFRHIKLDIFQFCLMMRHYEFYAPEECDCSTATTTDRLGQMFQMALQNSANRDPSKTGVPLKTRNLIRRLWYSVVHLDFYQLMICGAPSIISQNCYDTEFPHLDESETPFDYQIDKTFADRQKLYDICRPFLDLILNVREAPTVTQVKKYLGPIEEFQRTLPSIEVIMAKPSDTVIQRSQKIRYFHLLVDVVSFLNMIYYHFFLHYNSKKNIELSMFYMTSMLKNCASIYSAIQFFDPANKEFDLNKHFGCAVAVIQKIELALHRIIQIMFTLASRMKAYKTMVKNGEDSIFALIDQIAQNATGSMKHVIRGFDKISDYYYHAWVVSKCHTFITDKVLKMEKGPLGIITTTDVQFIATLKKEMFKDESIFMFSKDDFQSILNALDGVHSIDELQSQQESPANTDMLSEKDKHWLEQIIQDMSTQSTSIDAQFPFDGSFNFTNADMNAWDTIMNENIGDSSNGELSNGGSISANSESGASISTIPTDTGLLARPQTQVPLGNLQFPPSTPASAAVGAAGASNFDEFMYQYSTQNSMGL